MSSEKLLLIAFVVSAVGQPALSADLRIASWNMANYPNTMAQEKDLGTIIKAMGSEVVLGNERPIDILSLSETDPGSATATARIFNTTYDTTSYRSVVTSPDGGNDRTGFVYNSNAVSLFGTSELGEGLTHNMIRGHFRPIGIVGVSDFYMYSIQLKSGDSSAEETTRLTEAEVIRSDADTLGSNAHVIYGGDFNWQSADEREPPLESAWDVFTSEGNGQAFDTFDLDNVLGGGDWRNDEGFLHLHSQDPGGTCIGRGWTCMNDRFDMQFVTDEFFDGVGLEVVEGSYRVFGNNGTHELNEPITSGSGSSTDVLLALERFSDHLPVVTDFMFGEVLIGDIDGDGIVSFTDFLILTDNFGLEGALLSQGDIDGDQVVKFEDFLLLTENFGETLWPAVVGVPEPSTSVIFLGLLLCCCILARLEGTHPVRNPLCVQLR